MGCSLQVGKELLNQAKGFKGVSVLFTRDGKMERETDRQIGAASAVIRVPDHCPGATSQPSPMVVSSG